MSYYFFSDLHISHPKDSMYISLLATLHKLGPAQTIVFCGDIFDVFVGNKTFYKKHYALFFETLKKLNQKGSTLYYIEGNHDFLMKEIFASEGIPIHYSEKEFYLTTEKGKKIYCAHGDLINEEDHGYIFLRKFYRSRFFRFLISIAPGWLIHAVGKKLSRLSRNEKPLLPSHLGKKELEELRQRYTLACEKLLLENIDFVVMGHCHDFDEKNIKKNSHTLHYMNMGYPKVHKTFIALENKEDSLQRKFFD